MGRSQAGPPFSRKANEGSRLRVPLPTLVTVCGGGQQLARTKGGPLSRGSGPRSSARSSDFLAGQERPCDAGPGVRVPARKSFEDVGDPTLGGCFEATSARAKRPSENAAVQPGLLDDPQAPDHRQEPGSVAPQEGKSRQGVRACPPRRRRWVLSHAAAAARSTFTFPRCRRGIFGAGLRREPAASLPVVSTFRPRRAQTLGTARFPSFQSDNQVDSATGTIPRSRRRFANDDTPRFGPVKIPSTRSP